ncbi:hypothetical protein [Riemerella columbina]|uniref:hypothetical protein n=1 Tax=Riemerella columbina TaxID=103810 RepID=UPI0003762905|nr:hypothetical protein [Riemerella columbina]
MKKINLFAVTALLGLSCVYSCSRNTEDNLTLKEKKRTSLEFSLKDKENIESASLIRKIQYKTYFLKEAAKKMFLSKISNEDILNQVISSKIQKNTFKIQDLSSKFEYKTDFNNAFKNIEGRNYSISFYIPFAEELKNRTTNIKENIYIFEEIDDPNRSEYDGYLLNENGEFIKYQHPLTENLAKNLANKGVPVIIVGLQDDSLTPINGNKNLSMVKSISSTNKSWYIDNMTVKTHKESWVAGASEIAVQAYSYNHLNNQLKKINYINSSTAGSNSEYIFAKFKRKDVRRKHNRDLNAIIAGGIDASNNMYQNTNFFYVIYEADNWPVETRTVNFSNIGGIPSSISIQFGSSDPEYYNSNADGNKISSVVNNGEIYFKNSIR